MKYNLIDYKGKYCIIQDIDYIDELDIKIGEIKDEDITDTFLKEHIESCLYYGIPAYIGSNKELHNRISKIQETIE